MNNIVYRECGECTECCTMLEILALNKPKKTPCKFLNKNCGGCGDYDNRPQDCRGFQCAWSENILPIDHRPDKTGIMVYHVDSHMGRTMFVTETREGAFDESFAQKEMIISLSELRKTPLILAQYDGSATMMVP